MKINHEIGTCERYIEENKNIDITFSKDELRDLLLMVNDYRWECDLKKPKSHYKRKLKYHSRKL